MNKPLLKSSILLITCLALSQGNVLAFSCSENSGSNQYSCKPKTSMNSAPVKCVGNPNQPGAVNCRVEPKITSNNISCNGNKYSCGGNKK